MHVFSLSVTFSPDAPLLFTGFAMTKILPTLLLYQPFIFQPQPHTAIPNSPPCADTTLSNLSEFCSFCSYTTVYSCQYTYYFFLRREKVKTKTIFHINYLLKKYLLFDIRNCVSRSHLHSKIQSRCRVYAVFIIPFNQTQHEEI